MILIINAILLFTTIAALGAYLARLLDPHLRFTRGETLVLAGVTGAIVFGFCVLALTVLTGTLLVSAYIVIGIIVTWRGPSFLRGTREWWGAREWREWRITPWNAALCIVWIALVGVIAQILVFDSLGFPQGTLIGWGDVAYHMSMVGHMALGTPFPTDQPIASGTPLTYPFLINFFSALLLKLGFPFLWAWYLPSILFGTTLLVLLASLGRRVLQSRPYALLLVVLVIFGGGLGWNVWLHDMSSGWRQNGLTGIARVLESPPHEYTHLDDRTGGKSAEAASPLNIVWITPAISFFSHQRSFAVGFSLALVILLGWYVYGRDPHEHKVFPRWLLLLGLLPLTHSHTALAMALLFGTLTLQRFFHRVPIRGWVVGGVGALLVASPQLIHLASAGSGAGIQFFTPWFGWMTCAHYTSWFGCDANAVGTFLKATLFWLKNFGFVFAGWIAVLGYAALSSRPTPPALRPFIAPSIVLFAIPNLFKLQPWEFDNNKVLMYWWLLAALLIVGYLREFLRTRARWFAVLIVAIALFVGSTAGIVDASVRIQHAVSALRGIGVPLHSGYYGPEELVAAQWILEHTAANDAFLATDAPNNFIPMLTGRGLFLGYTGWLWTQGNEYLVEERKRIIEEFLATRDPETLCLHDVRWLMYDPAFTASYSRSATIPPERLGEIRFRQQLPNGERSIIQLSCDRT